MWTALTRTPGPELARCELTFLDRESIDADLAVVQHRAYEVALAELGVRVISLPAAAGLADAVFVEDAAIVLDRGALITRPGAVSRRAETATVAEALAPFRELVQMEGPGTLDGGDVLRVGRRIFVGLTNRTDAAGFGELARFARGEGYEAIPVTVRGALHLKTAVTALDDATILVNPAWIDLAPFGGLETIEVDPGEPFAANVVSIEGRLIGAAGFPETAERIRRSGRELRTLDLSELRKAEAGGTCMSLVFRA